jgi:hypothetical protein
MKFSKSAIRARQLSVAHMTEMQPVAVREDDRPTHRPYSTERYSSSTNNGIVVPQQLRDQIEAAMAEQRRSMEPEEPAKPAFSQWGFFGF